MYFFHLGHKCTFFLKEHLNVKFSSCLFLIGLIYDRYKGCNLKYQTMKSFKSHINEKHENKKEYTSEIFFSCDIANCNKKWIESLQTLIIHFYTHLGNNIELSCIFQILNTNLTKKTVLKVIFDASTQTKRLHESLLINNRFIQEKFESNETEMCSIQNTVECDT